MHRFHALKIIAHSGILSKFRTVEREFRRSSFGRDPGRRKPSSESLNPPLWNYVMEPSERAVHKLDVKLPAEYGNMRTGPSGVVAGPSYSAAGETSEACPINPAKYLQEITMVSLLSLLATPVFLRTDFVPHEWNVSISLKQKSVWKSRRIQNSSVINNWFFFCQ